MIRRHMVEISVLVAIFALVFVALASVAYTKRVDDSRREEQIAGCERANQQRAYINKIIEHHPTFELPPIPIPDCETIIK